MSKKRKIIIVDDDPQIRELVATILEDRGYAVLEADCGPSALKLVMEEQPDLVLLDFKMPGMDGCEVLRRLRQMSKISTTPVMVLSASLPPELCGYLGSFFMAKPFDVDRLLSVVAQLLDEAHSVH